MDIKKIILIFILIFSLVPQCSASHAMGIDVSYEYISPNKYYVCVNFYRDCSGIAAPLQLSGVNISSNSCNQSFILTLPMTAGPIDVSQLCPPQIPNSTCGNGTFTGVELYTYCDTIDFPMACADWIISYDICCRNASINLTNPISEDIYSESTINNLNGIENNSVFFTNHPIKYTCTNNNDCYNHGAVDVDGDSLSFKLVNPKTTGGLPIMFAPPFTTNNPISSSTGLQFNQVTGQMCFTPTTIGNWVITMMVEEWREISGVWTMVGSSLRDMQLVVESCTNTQPVVQKDINGNTIQNLSGGATMADSVTINICPGDSLNFQLIFTDPTPSALLTVTTNADLVCPNSVFTYSGNNPDTCNFNWIVPSGYNGQNIVTFKVENDICPIPGITYIAYNIYVLEGTTAGPDQVYCLGLDPVQLLAEGGNSFVWTPSTGLNNDSIADPIATPSQTMTYIVTSDLSSVCSNTDTVVVQYAASQNWTVGAGSTICYGENANVEAIGGNSYLWTPNYNIDFDDVAIASVNPDSSIYYQVEITDTNIGCYFTDSIWIEVIQLPEPDFTNDIVCERNPTEFLGFNIPGDSLIETWYWDFGDGGIFNMQNANHTFSTSGNYNVSLQLTDFYGCQQIYSTTVPVLMSPTADFITSNNLYQYILNTTISFVDLSVGASKYYWDFGNGDIDSSGGSPQYTYESGGIYDVELTIIASNDCPHNIIKQIEILTDPVLDIAMAFTPNNDGINDVLYPLSLGFNTENSENKFIFRIFNRWGTMVFESRYPKDGWDGYYKGVEQPIGVYVYYMSVLTIDNKEYNKKGDIVLLR